MGKVINFLLILSAILLLSQSCYAKLIEPRELQERIVKSYAKVNQLRLNLATTVFDYGVLHKPMDSKQGLLLPHELKEASFTQKMFWSKGQYLGIETFDSSRVIASIFFQAEGQRVNRQLREGVNFNVEDILFFHTIFYTNSIFELQRSLHDLGIPTNSVSLVPRDNLVLYRLGSAEENILMDSNNYRVLEINRLIRVDGSYYQYKISFSKWDRTKKRVPLLTRIYINSHLIKTTRVADLKFGNVAKSRSKFLQKYRTYLSNK